VDEAEVIERVAFIAHDEASEVAQPSEEALDLPAPLVAAQRAPILGLRAFAAASMRRNHLDTEFSQRLVQRVGVVGAIADEPFRQAGYEAGVEGGGDKRNLMRRSRGGTDGERKTKTVCHGHELRTFAPLALSHTSAPFSPPRRCRR
jgi:hypothetical protein